MLWKAGGSLQEVKIGRLTRASSWASFQASLSAAAAVLPALAFACSAWPLAAATLLPLAWAAPLASAAAAAAAGGDAELEGRSCGRGTSENDSTRCVAPELIWVLPCGSGRESHRHWPCEVPGQPERMRALCKVCLYQSTIINMMVHPCASGDPRFCWEGTQASDAAGHMALQHMPQVAPSSQAGWCPVVGERTAPALANEGLSTQKGVLYA